MEKKELLNDGMMTDELRKIDEEDEIESNMDKVEGDSDCEKKDGCGEAISPFITSRGSGDDCCGRRRKVAGRMKSTRAKSKRASPSNVSKNDYGIKERKKRNMSSGKPRESRSNRRTKETRAYECKEEDKHKRSAVLKHKMFEVFQPWVLKTYGDSAKTKTITKKKYIRILKTLRGEEINNADNSKFRFWVKAKGFHIGPPPLNSQQPLEGLEGKNQSKPELYVPVSNRNMENKEEKIFKKVAVVEDFFEIIYNVHVETEAKNGKHAGQKRTYRAITEKFAFLPREAVTKFLLQCMDCQKRGSSTGDQSAPARKLLANEKETTVLSVSTEEKMDCSLEEMSSRVSTASKNKSRGGKRTKISLDINFSLPFTTTYLRAQKRQMKRSSPLPTQSDPLEPEKALHSLDVDQEPITAEPPGDPLSEPQAKKINVSSKSKNGENKSLVNQVAADLSTTSNDWLGFHQAAMKKEPLHTHSIGSNNNIYSNGKHEIKEQSSPNALIGSLDPIDETSSNGNKDDDDDDDDDAEDKIDSHKYDPERLKAFNMFVRLFVDENLDRMVPISKQPKEKIQAIIDSCTRQFPEFAERARKRIRTYLKSCRRNKRTNGWESSRPTPAHLTSVQAEQILAQACENESQNAKRMRMGLEPVSQPMPVLGLDSRMKENGHQGMLEVNLEKVSKASGSMCNNSISSVNHAASSPPISLSNSTPLVAATDLSSSLKNHSSSASMMNGPPTVITSGDSLLNHPPSSGGSALNNPSSKTFDNKSPLLDYSRQSVMESPLSMYRSNIQGFQRPSLFPTVFSPSSAPALANNNGNAVPQNFSHSTSPSSSSISNGVDSGPTDLSMKSKPLLAHKLNSTEISTVRQLITGYRESAAFLLRSADELEQLLIQQQ